MSEITRVMRGLVESLRESAEQISVPTGDGSQIPSQRTAALASRMVLFGISNALLSVVRDEQAREERIGAALNKIDR